MYCFINQFAAANATGCAHHRRLVVLIPNARSRPRAPIESVAVVTFFVVFPRITNAYDKYSFPPNVIGFTAPRNTKLSANATVNRLGSAFTNIGTRSIIFPVCFPATSNAFRNAGAARAANAVPLARRANIIDGVNA